MVRSKVKAINTALALQTICITPSHLSDLAGEESGNKRLKKYGINPDLYYPELSEFIPHSEWINLVVFYSNVIGYEPARKLMRKIEMISTQQPEVEG
jgi:hypothetical protein